MFNWHIMRYVYGQRKMVNNLFWGISEYSSLCRSFVFPMHYCEYCSFRYCLVKVWVKSGSQSLGGHKTMEVIRECLQYSTSEAGLPFDIKICGMQSNEMFPDQWCWTYVWHGSIHKHSTIFRKHTLFPLIIGGCRGCARMGVLLHSFWKLHKNGEYFHMGFWRLKRLWKSILWNFFKKQSLMWSRAGLDRLQVLSTEREHHLKISVMQKIWGTASPFPKILWPCVECPIRLI